MSIIVAVVFVTFLVISIVSAKRTSARNRAAEETRAAIFRSQMEDRRREIEAEQKLEEAELIQAKPGVANYLKKRPVYSSDPEPTPIVNEEHKKLGEFFQRKGE